MKIKNMIILSFLVLFSYLSLYAQNNTVESLARDVKSIIEHRITSNALIEAAKNDDMDRVKILVKNEKINIDKTDEDGYTALMYAVKNRNEYMVHILLSNHADPNAHAWRGPSALWVAVKECHSSAEYNEEIGIISLLLRNGAKRDKDNAAAESALRGCLSMAKFLFENGAKIRNRLQNPIIVQTVTAIPLVEYPFMKRNEELYAQIIELLVKNKARVDIPDGIPEDPENRHTALQHAIRKGMPIIVQTLLDQGAEANYDHVDMAAHYGRNDIVEILTKHIVKNKYK